jgi:hypothetical protein
MNESKPNSRDELRLVPRRPPGRSSCKVRVFADEIGRLRAEGYSFEAIREALTDAGVNVSNSTVQREAARHSAPRPAAARSDPRTAWPVAGTSSRAVQAGNEPLDAADDKSALDTFNDLVDAFFRERISDPLIRPEEEG